MSHYLNTPNCTDHWNRLFALIKMYFQLTTNNYFKVENVSVKVKPVITFLEKWQRVHTGLFVYMRLFLFVVIGLGSHEDQKTVCTALILSYLHGN